ncbi:MAG: leucine-rich repeat protein [Verrucomicrobiales bacterium]|nr:leucine-rich repeat protein [Verrucomicrobiales bacterium]
MKTARAAGPPLMILLWLLAPVAIQAQFDYTVNEGEVTLTKYTGPGGAVVIPDTLDGLPVPSIGDRALQDCLNVTSVTMPDSVTRVEPFAFQGCTSLTSVTIPDSDELSRLLLAGSAMTAIATTEVNRCRKPMFGGRGWSPRLPSHCLASRVRT